MPLKNCAQPLGSWREKSLEESPPFDMGQIWSWLLCEAAVRAECMGGPCSRLASAVPAGLSCHGLAEGEASSSLHPPFPSRQLLLGDGAGSGLFSEASWRKGDYRHHLQESGVSLLLLCPMDPSALVKYLKTAWPGLGLEECHLWKVDSGAWGN